MGPTEKRAIEKEKNGERMRNRHGGDRDSEKERRGR
jgi:hypothetical protein